jgi:Zn-dependent protease
MAEAKVDSSFPSASRLWAEQLGLGLILTLGLLGFMAVFHTELLSAGMKVLGPNYLNAYGWASLAGIIVQVVVHELGSIAMIKHLKLPLKFRFFGFGANAGATLEALPREPWRDAQVGVAGPLAGTVVSLIFAGIYEYTKAHDESMQVGMPLFLGMACVGYFYNLFTLIPILDLEGGWIAPVIAPQWWLFGLVAVVLELTNHFNLVLVGVLTFGLPRFVHILRARAPRADLQTHVAQRTLLSIAFFVVVLGLAYFGSTTFESLPSLVLEEKGD